MRRRNSGDLSLDDLGGMFRQGLTDAVTRPTIHNYSPHPKQIAFHKSMAKLRQLIGGNRSGKTVGGTAEDVFFMRGVHPYKKVFDPPTRGRIVAVSYNEGIKEIIIPELKKWLPPSELINGSWEDSYHKGERKLELANGSTAELMSYEQDVPKFAGTSRHWTHFDEEPPKDIFTECRLRVLDTGGYVWMTMTPVDGMTWTYDDIHMPGILGDKPYGIFIVDTAENPFLSTEEIDEVIGDLDEDEKKARKQGHYVNLGGLVFKLFSRKIHVVEHDKIDIEKLLGWTQYQSLDHGLNNPTCWLWHAVNRDNLVITFDEIYRNETLISEFAQMIKDRNSESGRRWPEIFVGDPSITQRNAITKLSIQKAYAIEGIPIVLGNNDVAVGIERINSYLKAGKWIISDRCKNLISEMERLRWKIYENAKKRHENNPRPEIHKYKDHAPDSARYFFGLMPDLHIPKGELSVDRERVNRAVQTALGAGSRILDTNRIDPNLAKRSSGTEWTVVDEHMGGFY